MANSGCGDEDFFFGDDLDAVLALLDEDLPAESEHFDESLNVLVQEIDSLPSAEGFSCLTCGKVCKTKRGLSRHTNAKHARPDVDASATPKQVLKTPEQMLHPLSFKKLIETSVEKLASDECYSKKLCQEFSDYKVSIDDAIFSYNFVRDVIGRFKGNAEKFYPEFYKCVSSEEIVFRNLSRRGSIILGFDMANHVLAYLTGTTVGKEGDIDFSPPITFSSKEDNLIQYLSGYVFGTVYRRIRRSTSTRSMLGCQSSSILLAGKAPFEGSSSEEQNSFIHAKDRGGLWTVTSEVFNIFSVVEAKFRQFTQKFSKKIDSEQLVSNVLANPIVLANYRKLCDQASDQVSKEVALNLLEHLIILYVRVRTFSYVKDQCEIHNIQAKKKKARSLRTEMKRATGSLDQGH